MRSTHPFTARQIRLLEGIQGWMREVTDPNAEVTHAESYEWYTETISGIGKIPKIRFRPNSQGIKARIMYDNGLADPVSRDRKDKRQAAREAHNLKIRPKNDRQRLADIFDKEWNNIALKLKKAAFTASYANQLFATSSQKVASPIALLQAIITDEYKDQIRAKKPIQGPAEQEAAKKSYKEELMEVD